MTSMPDINKIIDYEAGELSAFETIELFAGLVASGAVWSLQGHYGRMAVSLIDAGYITDEGEITEYGQAVGEEGY